MTLFINACIRSNSRTKQLADCLLSNWNEPVEEVCLTDVSFPVVDDNFLQKRDRLCALESFDDPMFLWARQFAAAKRIVVAAPYWDLSFPAILKQYLEQINVPGITFVYTSDGVPQGLCRANQLFYVTTAGGNVVPEEYGFGYVKALAQDYYGIQDVRLIAAKGLDLLGANVEKILEESMKKMSRI